MSCAGGRSMTAPSARAPVVTPSQRPSWTHSFPRTRSNDWFSMNTTSTCSIGEPEGGGGGMGCQSGAVSLAPVAWLNGNW